MEQKSKKSKIWNLVLLKDSGQIEAFRAPEKALQKTASYVVLLFFWAVLSSVGWMWSRWEQSQLQNKLSESVLYGRSMESRLAEWQQEAIGEALIPSRSEDLTFLPSLGERPLRSEDIQFQNIQLQYDTSGGQFSVSFDLEKDTRSALNTEQLYWVLFLHGAHGLQVFPHAVMSRHGAWVYPQKGQSIEGLTRNRRVSVQFRAQGFFEAAGPSESVWTTLVLYDHRGSLLLRERSAVSVARREASR